VTVATVSKNYGDNRVDSARFELSTGHARFVLDNFTVGDEDARLFWAIMGSDPYHSEAHGMCEGPPTTTPQPGGSATTTSPPSTEAKCASGYEGGIDIPPGSYFLRVDSTDSRWTARIEELR
jgi:hypothetical protein